MFLPLPFPGAGPIGVVEELKDLLPTPVITFDGETYRRDYNLENSVGAVKGYFAAFDTELADLKAQFEQLKGLII